MENSFWNQLKKPIVGLAPMDGVTDAAFRYILCKYGKPDLIITEFTSVEGICHGAVKPLRAFLFDKEEKPILGQLFGANPKAFYKSAFVVAELGFDGIDINMGCPARNIASKGSGASLINTPELAKEIIRETKRASKDWSEGQKLTEVGLSDDIISFVNKHRPKKVERRLLPVSVKTRTGYNKNSVHEWISHLLEAKPAAITLHGRTFKQLYSGEADWEAIAEAAGLVHKAKCLILGNGDIGSMPQAKEYAKRYNVDGVLIGRAALGNPFIFSKDAHSFKEYLKIAFEHSKIYEKLFGTEYFVAMRKHLGWYCKGFPNAAEVRKKLMEANSSSDVKKIISEVI